MTEIPAAQLADFDQAYAQASTYLDLLVQSHQQNVDRVTEAGYPEEAAVSALALYLLESLTFPTVCSALAVAVVRLSRG